MDLDRFHRDWEGGQVRVGVYPEIRLSSMGCSKRRLLLAVNDFPGVSFSSSLFFRDREVDILKFEELRTSDLQSQQAMFSGK